MSTTYGYTKQVESHQQGSKHTLAILMSMLRVSLEAAWSMARVCLEYGWSMARVWLGAAKEQQRSSKGAVKEQQRSNLEVAWSMVKVCLRYAYAIPTRLRFVGHEITAHSRRDYGSLMTRLRLTISMLLMLTLGSSSVWGQDYSGVYYIGTAGYNANTPANNFYLCPTEGWIYYKPDDKWSDDGITYPNPFLTTYKCKTNAYHSGDPNDAIWYVEKHPTLNYYYIRHASDGKYVMSNGQIDGTTNANRMRVHLEAVAPEYLDDKALFSIYSYSGYLVISPKSPAGWNGNYKWYTVNSGNKDYLVGNGSNGGPSGHTETGGIIGTYTENDANAKFYLENALSIVAPTITNNNDGTFTITAASEATIYYTTDGSTPTTTSYTGTGTTSVNLAQTESLTVIKAIAKATNDLFPTIVTTYYLPVCEKPIISVSDGIVTITSTTEGATIHYTTDDSPATSTSTVYTGPFAKGDASTFRAIATKTGYVTSSETILLPPTEVSSSSQITNMNGSYILASNFTSSGSIGTADNPFKGIINGNLNTLTLGYPLVAYADGATIKNVILNNVNISSSNDNDNGNAGAICCEATGDTRIYNCGVLSGSVGGGNNVGGIVGLLDGRARVINCYNYAEINSGSNCGGIVGYNNVASTSNNLQTMVMNCMNYGSVTGGNAAPIYGGAIIHNKYSSADDTGLNNYCYFLYDEEKVPYVKTIADDKYNGALGAEERFLNRFEFFRMTLNSTRNLAAFYVTGDATQKDEMAKWVLDKSIAPYPILKAQAKYPSVVNPDAAHATAQTERNKGGLLGTLDVTISGVGGGAVFSAPSGATITNGSLQLNITDKDYDNFNYNYRKVQLPYYNEVGTGNYTKASDGTGRVVTGWKITSITGGTPGSFKTDTYDYPSFNFVDRKCTNKDLYGTNGSNRVFAQGAYWEVPDGVTAIEIEPYWAKAVYLSDANYDMTYNISVSGSSATANKYGVTVCGSCPTTINGQTVYNDITTATNNLGSNASNTVYDYAVVLVGNYHQAANNAIVSIGKPLTFMSADLDSDNEPDNTLFYYHNQRKRVSEIRFDFLNIPGIGMVKRTHDATTAPEPGIFKPQGWFEITNTVLIHCGQFEYAAGGSGMDKTILAPLILQGGVYEQFVSGMDAAAKNTNYILIGSNAWFKNFANGCHTKNAQKTPKVPINVAGGDYTNFYLTGIYQPAAVQDSENAECYIDGGRFSEVAGSGMQQVKGDVTWLINAADITSFYGGGINAAKPITGSISTTISNSYVDEFYGGPKFGDMSNEKTVTNNATDCHFGKFFGAGYGGTAYNRVGYVDDNSAENTRNWNGYVDTNYKRAYSANDGGISTNYEYEFIPHSDGRQTVARFFVNYASLSLASTRNVTSTLSGCTIGTFYGGGSLGAVNGNINSTLTNCKVTGSTFGAGFSASVPTVEVWNKSAYLDPNPTYNRTANVYNNANVKTPKDNNQFVVYTWSNTYGTNADPFTDTEDGKHYIHTDVSLDGLGSVSGKVTLNIEGTTTVGKSVYGGGEESGVAGDTEVNVTRGTIGSQDQGGVEYGNVYGGGKGKVGDKVAGYVKGNTTVNISQASAEKPTIIYHNVYGGGAYGSVGDFTYDSTTGMPTACAENTGSCTVNIQSGTFGWNGKENGMVFGSSRGDVATPEGTPAVDPNDRMAWVYSTQVNIGTENATTGPTIKGSIYGSGENGHTLQNTVLNINSGTVGIPTGEKITDDNGTPDNKDDDIEYSGANYPYRGNVYGGGCGTDTYNDGTVDKYNPLAGIVKGTTTIYIKGGHVVRNVYGAGAMGSVGGGTTTDAGKTTINVTGGRIGYDGNSNNDGCIFGAARGENGISTATSNLANVRETEVNINAHPTDATKSPVIWGSVFGGGEAGTVKEGVAVNMTGGLIHKDIYGGGALADTQTSNWDATGGTWADAQKSALHTTTVRATGGRVVEEIFGGGLGEDGKPAYVWGDVLLDLNGTTPIDETTHKPSTTGMATTSTTGCVVGQIFGCNNVNGTPKGDVMVHIYATQNAEADKIANTPATGTEGEEGYKPADETQKVKGRYDITAVYGGGNMAAYEPADPDNNKSEVIIDGCQLTSIKTVYGGGNAACTPSTNVTVNGTFEVEELFGGGNGLDDIDVNGVTKPNPGANVGYKNYSEYYQEGGVWKVRDKAGADTKEERLVSSYVYGTGKASVNIFGGTVHRVFGGSNTKGNVRISAVTLLDDNNDCEFCVDEAYGGGKSAPMDAEAKLLMSCIPGLKAAYGGAEAANIEGDVTLNITNGNFDRVFGGNNKSGRIGGTITVNIEETGCKPVIIGQLYGGGNQAPYTAPFVKDDGGNDTEVRQHGPTLNIRSFTSIGEVYGGGYGEGAIVTGDTYVNINEVEGDKSSQDEFMKEKVADVTDPATQTTGTDKVSKNTGVTKTFKDGDGDDANTISVDIPLHKKGDIGSIGVVFGGGNAAQVVGNTHVNIGTASSVDYVTKASGESVARTGITPVGADIRGNVYGGGNNAEVTGNTNVVIGEKYTSAP